MTNTVRVWDLFVRLFHWSCAALFLANYTVLEAGSRVHRYVGYSLITLVIARILWGFVGSPYARFSSFVPSPRQLRDYLSALRRGEHPYYLGHNPLGALMVLFLLFMLLMTGISGWLLTQDGFWSDHLMKGLHELCANAVMLAVGAHIAAVLWISHTTREPLVPAMLHGHKPEDAPQPLQHQSRQ